MATRYESETDSLEESEQESESDNIEGNSQNGNGGRQQTYAKCKWLGLVPPEILAAANFEIKGLILTFFKDISFFGKGHKDAYKNIDEVVEIANYFNMPKVTRNVLLLTMLPISFKVPAKDYLKPFLPGATMTRETLRAEFSQSFIPQLKIDNLKKNIQNLQELDEELLYEAWEQNKGLLWNCPQHDLNVQQETSTF